MSIEQQIKEIEGEIYKIKHDIEWYKRPEEKYENACREYMDYVIDMQGYEQRLEVELETLQAGLKKPWYEYVAPDRNSKTMRCFQIDNTLKRLRENPDSSEILKHREERREILENFWALMQKAETDLAMLEDQKAALLAIYKPKKVKAKKEPTKHEIRQYKADGEIFLKVKDVETAAKNGIEGMTVKTRDGEFVSIPKPRLSEIIRSLKGVEYRIRVTKKEVVFSWKTGYIKSRGWPVACPFLEAFVEVQ